MSNLKWRVEEGNSTAVAEPKSKTSDLSLKKEGGLKIVAQVRQGWWIWTYKNLRTSIQGDPDHQLVTIPDHLCNVRLQMIANRIKSFWQSAKPF